MFELKQDKDGAWCVDFGGGNGWLCDSEMEASHLAGVLREAFERETAALRDKATGRTTPPTDAEIDAHHEARGHWMVLSPMMRDFPFGAMAKLIAAEQRRVEGAWRWYACGANREFCAWPVVTIAGQTPLDTADVVGVADAPL